MKANYTHVSALLDRSGSMAKIKNDTIGGFNQFVSDQNKVPGQMTLSLSQFDNEYEVVYDTVPIRDVSPLTDQTFLPRGSTALLDSAARLIIDTGKKLSELPEEERPERVMFIILTDGEENSSREQSKQSLATMVKHQEEKYGWQFVYIGANQDSFAVGGSMGMRGVNFQATGSGTRAAYAALTTNVALNRAAPGGMNVDLTQKDIDAEEKK